MSDKLKIIVDNYGSADAPDAAKFGRGAVTLDEVKRAADLRRDLVNEQSDAERGPVRRD
jgi:hypothetical protein